MKTTLTLAASAAAVLLTVSHVAVAQDRETHAARLFDVSERIQRSGPCSELPFLRLTNSKMIAFLSSLLSGEYDDVGAKLPQYIACFEHQRLVVHLRTVIHGEFPGTEAAFKIADEGYFTEADIDEFIWLLEGTVKVGTTDEPTRTPNHKPPTPSHPSEEAVAALLESLQKEIQESAALVPIGADNRRTSQRKRRSQSRPTPRGQKQIQEAVALVERARSAREGTGSKEFVVARRSFAPPQSRFPSTIVSGPLTPTQIKNIRLHFQGCWTVPKGSHDARNLVVRIRIALLPDGSLRGDPMVVERSRMGARDYRAAAEAARRAVQECAPLGWLPGESYEQWQEIELTFDPRDLPG